MAERALEQRVSQLETKSSEVGKMLEDYPAWRQEMQAMASEIRALHREGARELAEADRILRENQASQRETEAIQRETQASLRETQASEREAQASLRESIHLIGQETDRRQRETDRMIQDLRKELGGLGQKFGGFAEGMALPSMERCLAERFGTTSFHARVKERLGGEELYLDALASSRGEGATACVVEVKSRLREEGIDQLLRALAAFPRFFPEHHGKRLLGVLAAVDAPPDLQARVLREGLVFARIRDDVFELRIPEGFEPRAFPNPAAAAVN